MLRRLKGLQRAPCAWSFRTYGCKKGLRKKTYLEKEDEGKKEVTVYRESHFEGRKEGEKERTKRGVNFLYEERLLRKEAVCYEYLAF